MSAREGLARLLYRELYEPSGFKWVDGGSLEESSLLLADEILDEYVVVRRSALAEMFPEGAD